MKKRISLLMAIAMIFALAIPAFASSAPVPGESTVTVTGSISAPTIEIEAPSESSLVLNPYKMKYSGEIKLLKDSQEQILSLPGVYVNKTNVDLMIKVTATATPSTDVVLVAAAPAAAGEVKQVELKFAFGEMSGKDGAEFVTANTTNKAAADFPAVASDATTSVIEYKKDTSSDTRIRLAATDGKTPNYFGFKFSGSATADPDTAWNSDDKIDVAVAVKATPVSLVVTP
jgi:type 1 fimbria pilin